MAWSPHSPSPVLLPDSSLMNTSSDSGILELVYIREKMSSPALQQLAAQGKKMTAIAKLSLSVVFFPINDTLRIQLRGY